MSEIQFQQLQYLLFRIGLWVAPILVIVVVAHTAYTRWKATTEEAFDG